MSHPSAPEEAQEVAQNLQHQLYYNGEVFELTFEGLKSYKEQSIA